MSDISDEAYDKTMATNVKSNHWLCQMVAPDMISRGGGSIMITSSVGAFEPSLHLGTYAISKLAVIGLVRNLAAEYGPQNIRVNAIAPGYILTEINDDFFATEEGQNYVKNIPMNRLGLESDLDGVLLLLASDASAFMTGSIIPVDGGHLINPL